MTNMGWTVAYVATYNTIKKIPDEVSSVMPDTNELVGML
jgi:hypothetical protein